MNAANAEPVGAIRAGQNRKLSMALPNGKHWESADVIADKTDGLERRMVGGRWAD